jgi:hypothetical protein
MSVHVILLLRKSLIASHLFIEVSWAQKTLFLIFYFCTAVHRISIPTNQNTIAAQDTPNVSRCVCHDSLLLKHMHVTS